MKPSNRSAHIRPLATTAMHGRAEALRHAGEPVIDRSIAISHFAPPAAVRGAVTGLLAGEAPAQYTEVAGGTGRLRRRPGAGAEQSAQPDRRGAHAA